MKVAITMRPKFRPLPFMLLLLYGAVGGCGFITDEGRIKIAQIGDEAITRADLYTHIQQFPIEQRYKAKSKDAKLQILLKLVETKLLLKEADRRSVQVTDDEIENEMKRRGVQDISPGVLEDYGPVEGEGHDHEQERQSQHEQIAMELRLAKMQRQAIPPGLTVSDEEVEQFYEANKERFVLPESVRIRFVTCPTIEEAQKILDRTRAGEDFAGIVRETSVATQGKAAQEWPPSLYTPLERIGPQELRDALREAESGDMIG
ncbi:MAG: SurA N-terminal domain-containing protein, partial [Candidatus Hydrogenedentes bacterium]|nr:SurA N-terminal domain-containing protein [Candidatus Hydrogenedentota bacterium]